VSSCPYRDLYASQTAFQVGFSKVFEAVRVSAGDCAMGRDLEKRLQELLSLEMQRERGDVSGSSGSEAVFRAPAGVPVSNRSTAYSHLSVKKWKSAATCDAPCFDVLRDTMHTSCSEPCHELATTSLQRAVARNFAKKCHSVSKFLRQRALGPRRRAGSWELQRASARTLFRARARRKQTRAPRSTRKRTRKSI